MKWNPPTGQRYVRVIRTIHRAWPITHPTNPTLDSWASSDDSKVMWVQEPHINSKTDVRLDL